VPFEPPHFAAGWSLPSLSALLLLGSPAVATGAGLEGTFVHPGEVQGLCQPIEGEHAASPQAAGTFHMTDTHPEILHNPERTAFQSFACGKNTATIYYFEYPADTDMNEVLRDARTLIRGGRRPGARHPEAILTTEDVLVVVSSRRPRFFERLLSHRREFPDLDDVVVRRRLSLLRCGTKKPQVPEPCASLEGFRRGTSPDSALPEDAILFGRYWEISGKGMVGGSGYEVLLVRGASRSSRVAAFGPIRPETAQADEPIRLQIEAQRIGRSDPGSGALLAYARESFGKRVAPARVVCGRSLAFLGSGNRAHVRRAMDELILMTSTMHGGEEEAFVVAVFPIQATGRLAQGPPTAGVASGGDDLASFLRLATDPRGGRPVAHGGRR